MQLVLLEKIKKLGKLGDIVKVRPGYARNFLLPQKKAVSATKENLHKFEEQRAQYEAKANDQVSQAEANKTKLENLTLEILVKASEEGRLYGSIGPKDIVDATKEHGVTIQKQSVQMPYGLIRQLGEYEVVIQLHSDVSVTTKVVVADIK